jgi:hypothetical protein
VVREDFIATVNNEDPTKLVANWLTSKQVAACKSADDYAAFKNAVQASFNGVSRVEVVGSGNWGFSLNPRKGFKPFDNNSDIDVAIVSSLQFEEIWKEYRAYQRSTFYKLSSTDKSTLTSVAGNVYCGFVSPVWAPVGALSSRTTVKNKCNLLSTSLVDYKPVKVMFFKSDVEMLDYYKRGVHAVRKG